MWTKSWFDWSNLEWEQSTQNGPQAIFHKFNSIHETIAATWCQEKKEAKIVDVKLLLRYYTVK